MLDVIRPTNKPADYCGKLPTLCFLHLLIVRSHGAYTYDSILPIYEFISPSLLVTCGNITSCFFSGNPTTWIATNCHGTTAAFLSKRQIIYKWLASFCLLQYQLNPTPLELTHWYADPFLDGARLGFRDLFGVSVGCWKPRLGFASADSLRNPGVHEASAGHIQGFHLI